MWKNPQETADLFTFTKKVLSISIAQRKLMKLKKTTEVIKEGERIFF